MRLSKKQEQGLEAACAILSDVAGWDYEEERERLDLAYETLSDMLESSRKQKAKEREKRAVERRKRNS